LIWDILVYAVLTVLYIGGLFAFMKKIGQYGRLNTKRRRIFKLLFLVSGLVMVWLTINLVIMLQS
jgi:type IV secretory pathway component VirB8